MTGLFKDRATSTENIYMRPEFGFFTRMLSVVFVVAGVGAYKSHMRRFPPILLLLTLSASFLTFITPDTATAVDRPNILMILTDDQRSKGVFEYMPEVKRLGTEGAVFDKVFATTPYCCPSRAL